MARPAGRTRSDVKPPIRERWAPLSRTPAPASTPAPWAPKPRESLGLKLSCGLPDPGCSRVPSVAPASSLLLLPSSRSRKRPGHIGSFQIRRCPNKGCSGGGSFLLLIWRFRVVACCSLAPSLLPGSKPGARTCARAGDTQVEVSGLVELGAPRLRRLPSGDWTGEARARGGGEGESGRGSATVIQGPPAHLWDRGSGAGAKGRSDWAGWGTGRPGEAER